MNTTTSCSTSTPSAATVAATRTSPSRRFTRSSTTSTTASSVTSRACCTNDTSTSGAAALAEWKLAAGADGWNGERLFQAARFVTEMEYQHLVFEEFARKVQPGINPFEPFAFTQTDVNPAITAEFAHAVYRFGHSMLMDTIPRTQLCGVRRCWGSAAQRHRAPGRVPQPGGLLPGRERDDPVLRRGRRRDHHGSVRPGRPGDRRVRRQHPAQQPARPPARPARHQHDTGPQ